MMKLSLTLVILTLFVSTNGQKETTKIANYLFNEIQKIEDFTQIPEINELITLIKSQMNYDTYQNGTYPLCSPCTLLFTLVQKQPITTITSILEIAATAVCTYAKLYPFHVCLGAVKEMTQFITQNVWLHYTEPDFMCPGLTFCKPVYHYIDIKQKIQDIIKDTPSLPPVVPKKQKIVKMLHFTDIHTDLDYEIGKNQNCGEPICCRFRNGNGKNESDKAGKWGSRNCDLPEWTLEQSLKFIKNNLNSDFEFSLWTGDNTAHDIWHQSKRRNIENTKVVTKKFKEYFPGTLFFPQMGNHESFPVNVYDYFGKREQDLQNEFSSIWEEWIGKEAAQQEKELGFYSTYYAKYNLRILGINTQACNDGNWYLLRNPTDPFGQLDWIEEQLLDAENKKQLVFIISHIPSSDCLEPWGSIYNALITRFQHTIRGQYFGHTHDDKIEFYKDLRTNETIGYNMQCGSLTPSGKNPTFRILELDAETLQVIDYQQYRLDLEKWNLYPDAAQIIFDNAYNFTSEYNVTDMWNYTQMHDFQEKLLTDLDLFNKFNNNLNKGVYKNKTSIDKGTYCDTYPTKSLQKICNQGSYKASVFEQIAGAWRYKNTTNNN